MNIWLLMQIDCQEMTKPGKHTQLPEAENKHHVYDCYSPNTDSTFTPYPDSQRCDKSSNFPTLLDK